MLLIAGVSSSWVVWILWGIVCCYWSEAVLLCRSCDLDFWAVFQLRGGLVILCLDATICSRWTIESASVVYWPVFCLDLYGLLRAVVSLNLFLTSLGESYFLSSILILPVDLYYLSGLACCFRWARLAPPLLNSKLIMGCSSCSGAPFT